MAPYKVYMWLFIHDNYDVVCWLLTSTADQQRFKEINWCDCANLLRFIFLFVPVSRG